MANFVNKSSVFAEMEGEKMIDFFAGRRYCINGTVRR